VTYAFVMPSSIQYRGSFTEQRKSTASNSSGVYQPSPTDFIHSFYAVLRRWRSETAFYSDPDKITSHPSFLDMVRNAKLITPLIIDELRIRPSLLVWVLDDAYADKPYSDDVVGDIGEMTNAWISWADRNGFQV
jgi:hypothetical protein